MGTPYIGSHISLISKNDIRYEGTLYTIDTKESNIALANVKSFGTEGRRLNGPQIAPGKDTYEYIIFKGSDIKDLKVLSSKPTGEEQEPKQEVRREQAPPTALPSEEALHAHTAKADASNTSMSAASASAEQQPIDKALPGDILPLKPAATLTKNTTEKKAWTGKQASEQLGGISGSNGSGERQYEQKGRSRGRGGYRGSRNGRPYDRQQVPDITIPSEDFDFNKMFAQFKKEEVYKEILEETSEYNKDDFFDSMSSDVNKSRERPDFHEIRKLDSETFGLSAQRGRRGGRGGYRGRGRGGRGRGRGGGRGRGRGGHYRDSRNRQEA